MRITPNLSVTLNRGQRRRLLRTAPLRVAIRPPVGRTLALLVLAQNTAWWDPFNWVQKVEGIATDVEHDIINWVEDVINWAFTMYDAVAQATMEVIDDGMGFFDDAFGVVTNEIGNIYNSINNILGGWIDNIINVVEGAARDLYNAAVALANIALDAAVSFIGGILADIEGAATAIFNDFIDPVWQWVQNAENWVFGKLEAFGATLLNAVHSLYDDALHDIEAGLAEVVNLVGGEVMTAVKAIEAAWDWIVWFGEHALEDFIDIPGEISAMGHFSAVKDLATMVSDESGVMERMVQDFFGS